MSRDYSIPPALQHEPRHPIRNARPFMFAPPGVGVPITTTLGQRVWAPTSPAEMVRTLERIGLMKAARADDIVEPPRDDADEIRRDHIAGSADAWADEREIMVPELCAFLWHSMWAWIARKGTGTIRVDSVTITVDLPHEVTGRVQVTARLRMAIVEATPAQRGRVSLGYRDVEE